MARILITGGKGALGRWMAERLRADDPLAPAFPGPHEVWAPGRDELDVTLRQSCQEKVSGFKPDLFFNCAAYTAVDKAEEQKTEAYRVNRDGAGYAAESARKAGARFIHFSTDYVFPGTRSDPYAEEDPPHPINVYGASKLGGELKVMSLCPDHAILRTAWLYGPYGPNFVRTIVKLARTEKELRVVEDQWGSPTFVPDLAAAAFHAARLGLKGKYHVCNEGVITWHEFATAVVAGAGLTTPVTPIVTEDFPRPARRPAYSALNCMKIRRTKFEIRDWKAALDDFFRMAKEGKADPL